MPPPPAVPAEVQPMPPPLRRRQKGGAPGAQTARPGAPPKKPLARPLGPQKRGPDLQFFENWRPVGAGRVLYLETIPYYGMTALAAEGKAWEELWERMEMLVALDGRAGVTVKYRPSEVVDGGPSNPK